MARRGHRNFVRPAPKSKIWLGANVAGAAIAGNTTVLFSVLNATALALRPFTILRTRMLISWSSDQSVASETAVGSYGRIIVKEKASGIGATAIPNPTSDTDADWLVYQGLLRDFLFKSAVGFDDANSYYTIDSKAMRKVGPTDDLIGVVDNDSADGALFTARGRTLIQLH